MVGRAALSVASIVVASHAAFAQGVNANADALFHQGRDLMAAGKYAEACSAFEASEKADAAVTTLLNLADCREKNNQLATAWALFLDAERQTRDAADASTQRYHDTALEHANKLEPTLSKLAIDVGDHVAGLTITRAGAPVDAELWNRSLPIDGGSYTIRATAPGYQSWQTTVEVAASGDSKVNQHAGEECDQGSSNSNDRDCTQACKINVCGDGFADTDGAHHEQCDDGNTNNKDGCDVACQLPTCGNGIIDQGEQCDDGNTVSGDGCSSTCLYQ